MSDYSHDIFLSVKSDNTFGEWVSEIFIPLFQSYINQDIIAVCGRRAQGIFYYRNSIQPGDPWPDELRVGIRSSRVAVALCSPEYFFSDWCLTEFHSFWERGKSRNKKLLIPASIYDGDGFPTDIKKNLQFEDFSTFVIVGEGFKLTKKYSEFQEQLKEFSRRVAELVCNAPAFEEWPLIEMTVGGAPAPEVEQQTLSI